MADLTTIAFALKTLYPRGIHEEILKESPLLAMLPKNNEFYGENMVIPVMYAGNRARSADIADALSRSGSDVKGVKFILTRKSNYATFTLGREAMLATEKDKGSLVDLLSKETETALQTFRKDMGADAYGSGSGKRGRLSAAAISGASVTLTDPNDTINFEVGDVVELGPNDSATGLRTGSLTISKVDRDAGTLTFTANVTAGISAAAASDYVFHQGDAGTKPAGIGGWIPSAAPTSGDSWYGVDRSVDPSKLAGIRFDGSAHNHEEALQRFCARLFRHGAKPKDIFMNPEDVSALEILLGSKKEYEDVEGPAGIGFTAVRINSPYGKVRVFGDPWAPKSVAWALSLDTWKLHSLKDVPHFVTEDGSKLERQSAADGFKGRIAGYYNYGCEAPGQNGRCTLATV